MAVRNGVIIIGERDKFSHASDDLKHDVTHLSAVAASLSNY